MNIKDLIKELLKIEDQYLKIECIVLELNNDRVMGNGEIKNINLKGNVVEFEVECDQVGY